MKSFITFCLLLAVVSVASAQETLAPDQNPNYAVSRAKYMDLKDSLTVNMNTTEQDTYKAYDWYQEKQEWKAARRQARLERRYLNALNGQYYNGYYNNGFYNPYNSYYNYSPSYNNWGRRNWFWNNRPFIGFRTGNWWFGF
jgi:hypothetical protein